MLYYIIFIIYEDGSEYQSVIKNQKDVDKIPSKNKAYETIRIFYYDDNTEYSHVIYGRDNVFLKYDDNDKCLYYSQFDDDQEFTQVIKLKGIGKEEIIFTESTKKNLPITFKGAGLPDDEYEKLVQRCHQYRRWSPAG